MARSTFRAESAALPEVIVIDTCVLVSSVLRTLLLRCAADGWFIPVWSSLIGKEWQRTAARLWQCSEADICRQWDDLQARFPQADIGDVSEFVQGLVRGHPGDWHVVAAGRAAQARSPSRRIAILTRNIKDFHRAELRGHGLALMDPDQLLSRMWACDAHGLFEHLRGLPDYARAPGRAPESLETMLKRERLFRLNRLCREFA